MLQKVQKVQFGLRTTRTWGSDWSGLVRKGSDQSGSGLEFNAILRRQGYGQGRRVREGRKGGGRGIT